MIVSVYIKKKYNPSEDVFISTSKISVKLQKESKGINPQRWEILEWGTSVNSRLSSWALFPASRKAGPNLKQNLGEGN